MNREEWLERRRQGIGASDAAAVVGMSPWLTPLELYLDKTGQKIDRPMTQAQRMGLKLEPIVAEMYAEETGNEIRIPEPLQKHPETPWIMANPDRETADQSINIQIKTTAFRDDEWGSPGTDEVPDQYLIQVQHEMYVTGQEITDLAVLFLAQKEFAIYPIKRSERLIETLIEQETAFWKDHVEPRIPPEPDFDHPTTLKLLSLMYNKVEDKPVEICDEDITKVAFLVSSYKDAGERIKELNKQRDHAKARMLSIMGESNYVDAGDWVLTRKEVHTDAYQVKPKDYVRFSIKKGKRI